MDRLVQLFSCGYVLPVVGYVHRCMASETLDHSLIRHFVSEVQYPSLYHFKSVVSSDHHSPLLLLQVLAIIQPPYSPDLTAVFLPLVQSQEIAGPLTNSEHTDPLSTFLGRHMSQVVWLLLCVCRKLVYHAWSPSIANGAWHWSKCASHAARDSKVTSSL